MREELQNKQTYIMKMEADAIGNAVRFIEYQNTINDFILAVIMGGVEYLLNIKTMTILSLLSWREGGLYTK